jgi:hypothetical protein
MAAHRPGLTAARAAMPQHWRSLWISAWVRTAGAGMVNAG